MQRTRAMRFWPNYSARLGCVRYLVSTRVLAYRFWRRLLAEQPSCPRQTVAPAISLLAERMELLLMTPPLENISLNYLEIRISEKRWKELARRDLKNLHGRR